LKLLAQFIGEIERNVLRIGVKLKREDWNANQREALFTAAIKNTLTEVIADITADLDIISCRPLPISTATYPECELSITYKRQPSSNGELHKYWLNISLINNSPQKQEGYTLAMFFPVNIPVECDEAYEVKGVEIDGIRFRKLVIFSHDTIYRQAEIQIADEDRNAITYQMNSDLYWSDKGESEFRWKLCVGNLPAQEGSKPWTEMHCF